MPVKLTLTFPGNKVEGENPKVIVFPGDVDDKSIMVRHVAGQLVFAGKGMSHSASPLAQWSLAKVSSAEIREGPQGSDVATLTVDRRDVTALTTALEYFQEQQPDSPDRAAISGIQRHIERIGTRLKK